MLIGEGVFNFFIDDLGINFAFIVYLVLISFFALQSVGIIVSKKPIFISIYYLRSLSI